MHNIILVPASTNVAKVSIGTCTKYNLGGCYPNGEGVDRDVHEAARGYKLAADQGLAVAQDYLVKLPRYWVSLMRKLSVRIITRDCADVRELLVFAIWRHKIQL